MSAVWKAIREPLAKNGLSVIQFTQKRPGQPTMLATVLGHSSGQWIRGDHPIVPQRNDPQGIKSAITYASRTSLQAMVGVAPADDDDGNVASGVKGSIKAKPAPPNKPTTAPSGPAKSPRLQERGREAFRKAASGK